jgi:RadC-like JAB domain-containing protein
MQKDANGRKDPDRTANPLFAGSIPARASHTPILAAAFPSWPLSDVRAVPSSRDAKWLCAATGRLLDIPVHDHLIIGRGCYTSFAEGGLL